MKGTQTCDLSKSDVHNNLDQAYRVFRNACRYLRENSLTKLNLTGVLMHRHQFKELVTTLRENTSLEELNVNYVRVLPSRYKDKTPEEIHGMIVSSSPDGFKLADLPDPRLYTLAYHHREHIEHAASDILLDAIRAHPRLHTLNMSQNYIRLDSRSRIPCYFQSNGVMTTLIMRVDDSQHYYDHHNDRKTGKQDTARYRKGILDFVDNLKGTAITSLDLARIPLGRFFKESKKTKKKSTDTQALISPFTQFCEHIRDSGLTHLCLYKCELTKSRRNELKNTAPEVSVSYDKPLEDEKGMTRDRKPHQRGQDGATSASHGR